jgi:acetoin utilization deacetylase AcuC-like enzyme
MKVFYDSRMSVDSGGYSPSGSKPAAVVADWMNLGIEVCEFEPATEEDLCLAHSPKYVSNVLSGREANGHGNQLPRVTEATRWTCGSMVAASRQALIDHVACSPSSGFHHAGYESGGAFCTFNGLIVAARKLQEEGIVERVGIIDCDVHYGDGTDDIIQTLDLSSRIRHWTFGAAIGRRAFDQTAFLDELRSALVEMQTEGVRLILYQAGADPHVDDPLGGVMTTEEMRERDKLMFSWCKQLEMPVAVCLAGGYQRDKNGGISKVLALHRATMEEAITIFGQPEMG